MSETAADPQGQVSPHHEVPAHELPAQAVHSVFTSSLFQILDQLNISLAVSTGQAGKVVLIRGNPDTTEGNNATGNGHEAGTVNTLVHNFENPMGTAIHMGAARTRLTVGGARTIWNLRNMPAVARKLAPEGKYDACFLLHSTHITGDIDILELAWGRTLTSPEEDELWIVNTRFSSLCTLDNDYGFHLRWCPHFVTAYAPEDRCHLNGLALVDGLPKYVTALGETNTASGWRANKVRGGILMDAENNEVLVRGLSMPHSPRWYRNQLYVLESGAGTLSRVELDIARETQHLAHNGKLATRPIAQLPGFTRGIDFYGPLAFIGLSQVRETATRSGIPLVDRLGEEHTCGIWVVNIETEETLGFLRFESGVQEIFAVQVLPGIRYPEILEWGDECIGYSYILPDGATESAECGGGGVTS